jgi:AcrR family transcriptional regulator
MNTSRGSYHHGHLRPALIAAAVEIIADAGPAGMTLRAAARRAGVTHAAAAYHFGSKAGLLTAVAADGYRRQATALTQAVLGAPNGIESGRAMLEMGVAYVRFAVTHPAHFEVMYRPELYHSDDPDLLAAKAVTRKLLYGSERPDEQQLAAGVAAWSIVHGLATLWLNGDLPDQLGNDIDAVTRQVAAHLRLPRRRGSSGVTPA